MSLGQPLGLLALLALAPLAAAWGHSWYWRRRADARYGGAVGLRRGRSRMRAWLRASLLVAAVVLLTVAIARPRWGSTETPLSRRGIDVMIALDISRSMQAKDVQPTRAAAAASGVSDMLRHLRGDRVGLVTFGGSPFARSPLTLDLDAIADLVGRAERESALVRPGSDIGLALNLALQGLDVPDAARAQVIVLVSDGELVAPGGENLEQRLADAIRRAQDKGVRVYTVAVGTEQGAPVPGGEGVQGAPREGVTTRADRRTLQRIADGTRGDMREAGRVAGLAVEFARLRQTEFDQGTQDAPIERFQWFLGAALALLVAQMAVAEGRRLPRARRRLAAPATALLALAIVFAGCGGTAAYRKVEEGNRAYERGDYEQALASYRSAKELLPSDPAPDYNSGNALHELRRYDEATAASKAAVAASSDVAVTARATYALGNHAFRRDALEEAREAYVSVLLRDPSDRDAKHNLELVLRTLQPPPSQPGQQQQPGAPGGPMPAQPGAGTATPQAANPSGAPAPTTPSAGAPSGPMQPGGQPQGGATRPRPSGAPPSDAEQARAELLEALEAFSDGLTLEEALAILDRARQASDLERLERGGPRGGFDPNDR